MVNPSDTIAAMLQNGLARPYPHQDRVCEHLLAGRSVVLQAPTGSGKTEAALLPFLHARHWGLDFPRKCLYAVPLRTLANQFKARADKWVAALGDGLAVTIQTGEHPEDRKFEGDLVFATIDQVLSSFLVSPYSLPHSQANLNLGAIAGSYLVFDEVHLFDRESTLSTTLVMLRLLANVSPFLLMTATLSQEMVQRLADFLGAVVVPGNEQELGCYRSLPCQQHTRRYHWHDQPLTAEDVAMCHQGRNRSIVVCNTVERATSIYAGLQQLRQNGVLSAETKLILLHSRFLKEDRARKEAELVEWFGKDEDRHRCSAIAVATQVIEVGLDISCEVLHSDLAPANSIVQRAGRNARYENEHGDVHIYPVDSPAPYVGAEEALLSLTREVLPELLGSEGKVLGFSDELELVNRVHAERDRKDIHEDFALTWVSQKEEMEAVMDGHQPGGRLVRAIDSRLLLIHPEPSEVAEAPFAYEGFGLHPSVLYGAVKGWLERGATLGLDWSVQALQEYPETDSEGPRFQAYPVHGAEDLKGAFVALVNPALAGYDPELGLMLQQGNGFACRRREHKEWDVAVRRYRMETYQEHVAATLLCFEQQVWPGLAGTATRVERALGWPTGMLRRVSALAVALHDTGKLSSEWQGVAKRYMAMLGQPVADGVLLAHTEYDDGDERCRKLQHRAGKRPPHACEGAYLALGILMQALGGEQDPARAAFSAIARHHSAFSSSVQEVRAERGAQGAIARALALAGVVEAGTLSQRLIPKTAARDLAAMEDGPLVWAREGALLLAYGVIVRAVRLSDQMGTAMHSGEVEANAVD